MKLAVRRTSTAIAAIATASISGVLVGAAPANAATEACGDGTLISPGVCEQTFTSGTAQFTPTASMTKLEALLVGAGGAGASVGNAGYAAGGGGEVKVVDLTGSGPLTVTVPTSNAPTTVTGGIVPASAANGLDGNDTTGTGGASGSGKPGGNSGGSGGGGGGTAGAAAGTNGGAGATADSVAGSTSLFHGDATCYGGGGAAGSRTSLQSVGVPGCGAGGPNADATAVVAPAANRGGGGGAVQGLAGDPQTVTPGAAGVVVLRWTAADVTLSFNTAGKGAAPSPESVVPGTAPTRPADPSAEGFQFEGWYTDSSYATPADFSTPLTRSTTFFARWSPTLAATGVDVGPAVPLASLFALLAGAGLVVLGTRRRRSS
ncbi:InlB B-repeat-containing protein [Pseudolysinimonas sp.]|uniref:InlB B-repeat-containing protein n=1 Tax=Pseudolysinimonas sp. TaxID=2680009 RepID=UPI003F7F89CA